jgi:hypothetical protein
MRCTGSKTGAKGSYKPVQIPRFPPVVVIVVTVTVCLQPTDGGAGAVHLAAVLHRPSALLAAAQHALVRMNSTASLSAAVMWWLRQ